MDYKTLKLELEKERQQLQKQAKEALLKKYKLYDKEYAPDETHYKDYPHEEVKGGKTVRYRLKYHEISDQEFEELKSMVTEIKRDKLAIKKLNEKKSSLSAFVFAIGVATVFLGGIIALMFLSYGQGYGFFVAIASTLVSAVYIFSLYRLLEDVHTIKKYRQY